MEDRQRQRPVAATLGDIRAGSRAPAQRAGRLRDRLRESKWYPCYPIALAAVANVVVWAVALALLSGRSTGSPHAGGGGGGGTGDLGDAADVSADGRGKLLAGATLAYSYGLRHALDADHITAIDNLTRALVGRAAAAYRLAAADRHAAAQSADTTGAGAVVEATPANGTPRSARLEKPVMVGLFFSLGHSTIVVVATAVVAGTSSALGGRFDSFRDGVGGYVGTTVSMAFLLLIGAVNAYTLARGVRRMRRLLRRRHETIAHEAQQQQQQQQTEQEIGLEKGTNGKQTSTVAITSKAAAADKDTHAGGVIYRLCHKLFRLIDRPWKMYPLGVLFGLGFDTSTEVALLGIASIQGSSGTPVGYVMLYPLLFTCGMVLVDTADGAAMYMAYASAEDPVDSDTDTDVDAASALTDEVPADEQRAARQRRKLDGDCARQAYSLLLTTVSVCVAVTIGVIQLLNIVHTATAAQTRFWDGVDRVSDRFDLVGGAIVAAFVVLIAAAALTHWLWRRHDRRRRAGAARRPSEL